MQKDEFLGELKKALYRLPESEQVDVIADYEEHFTMGVAAGRNETDIAAALGDPRVIGKEFIALSLVRRAEEDPSAGGISRAVVATLGLGLFNLLVVFIPFIILIILLAVILVVVFSLTCAGPFLTGYAVLELLGVITGGMPVPPLAGVFFGIGLTSSGLLLMVLTFCLIRIFYRLGIRYLRWNIAVISGRESL